MKKIIAAAIVATALTGAVNAATIVQNINFDNQLTDFTQSATFNLFDSSIGTLNSVTIQSAFGFTTTITVTNNGGSSNSGDVYTTSYVKTNSSNGAINSLLSANYDTLSNGYGSSATTGISDGDGGFTGQAYTVGAGQTVTLGSMTSPTKNKTINLTTGLAAFTGAAGSTADFIASTLTKTTLNTVGGNTAATQVTNANADFVITYNYTSAVPEPMTWAMMIGGFGFVGYGLRRRGVAVAFN